MTSIGSCEADYNADGILGSPDKPGKSWRTPFALRSTLASAPHRGTGQQDSPGCHRILILPTLSALELVTPYPTLIHRIHRTACRYARDDFACGAVRCGAVRCGAVRCGAGRGAVARVAGVPAV